MPRFRAAIPQPLIYPTTLVVLAVVYYGAARLGLQYASIGQSISLVWPPTGIAFAALTLLGYRYWPGIALGAFFANAATSVPLLAAAGIALGNTLEAVVAASLLRRTAGSRPQLEDLRQVRTLVLVAAPVGALCSALIGTLSLWLTGALGVLALPAGVAVWWTGDVLGALVVAPVFFSWTVPPQAQDSTRRLIEVVVLCVGTFVAAELGLGRFFDAGFLRQVDYQYLLFPFVIWAGVRFGARGASLMTLTVSALTVGHAVQGGGPFVGATAAGTLFEVATYLGVVAVTGLVLAAAVRWERYQAARAEERLRQAHRMESVGRLAGGVAHETNNQMSVVLGAADFVLGRDDLPEAVREDVEFIRKAAERTAAVTGQLLAFSRRQILQPKMLDLSALVRNWEPMLRRIMGEDAAVSVRLSPDLGLVRADPGQLEQVLINLALNAKDAMPRGGRVTIETFRAELGRGYARLKPGTSIRPGEYAVLAVSDTGHGMDRETLSHIFEPFFTTKGAGRGTGLGLATVYGIVKQSEGYVWPYSEPEQGTTFKIYLPIRTGAVAPVIEEPAPPRSRVGERILLVEDEQQVRSIMKRALEGAGYEVLDTGSAAHALDLARTQGRLSLVLTDVVMPGMNGRELAARIGELMPNVPVLFTSGYTDGEIERRGLLRPGAAFIQKPITPDALVRAVGERLQTASPLSRAARGGVA